MKKNDLIFAGITIVTILLFTLLQVLMWYNGDKLISILN